MHDIEGEKKSSSNGSKNLDSAEVRPGGSRGIGNWSQQGWGK